MNKLFIYLALLLMAFIAKTSGGQDVFQQPVPIDPELRYGVLENGLTYYIKKNSEPKERASFYIIQNVGALLEEDNQNGLAHFLEHMAFNGTKNFEGKGILNTLERHGVAFGRNINAYTSFSETVYNLSDVPSTNEGLIDTCLLILHDWSDYLLLTNEEIDLERGVIAEEWRTRRNANFRMRSQWFPVLFKGSKWAERDVIGDTTVIKYHLPETLRNFYHDWYRTDLQAIAIVGDFDPDAIEAKVKELFSKIPAVENPKPKPDFKIPHHNETYFALATDKETTQSQISLYILHENDDEQPKTLNYLRDSYIRNLYNMMTTSRIQELLQKGTPPFVAGYTQMSDFVRGYDTYVMGAVANPNEQGKAIEAIVTETERIRRFGFLESELDRAKANYLTQIESQYKQKDKIKNDAFCQQYSAHFLTKEPVTGIDFSYNFSTQVIPTITAEEVSERAKAWIKPTNRTVVILGPSEGVEHIDEEGAKAIIAKVESMEIEPYTDNTSSTSLINEKLKGSKIKSVKKLKEFNAVEWTLANKAKVIYRHADYEKDEVSLTAFSKGGTSLFDDQYIPSAEMLETFISAYGVGEFDAIALRKMLAGKKVSISPSLESLTEGFRGSSTPGDFETLMQLVYLFFEKPRFDNEAHDALMARYIAYMANIENDPRKTMQDSLMFINANYHPRVRSMNTAFLNEVSFEDIQKIYLDRFTDASDFVFFIVGNIDEKTAKDYTEKYIGSLTSLKRNETWKDRGIRNPSGETRKVIPVTLTTPKANVNVLLINEIKFNQENRLKLDILKAILDLRYTETIREEEGGTYGVRVGSNLTQYPVNRASINITFDCDPERAEALKAIVYREIEKIVTEGPSDTDFEKAINNKLKDREQARNHNNFWTGALYSYYYTGINTAAKENFENILSSMKKVDIQNFASQIMSNNDLIDITFVPKTDTEGQE